MEYFFSREGKYSNLKQEVVPLDPQLKGKLQPEMVEADLADLRVLGSDRAGQRDAAALAVLESATAEALIRRSGGDTHRQQITVAPQLVERKSSAAPARVATPG